MSVLGRMAALGLLAFTCAVASTASCGSDDVDILECTGECECDQSTSTCSCLGGTDCTVEGGVNVTLICEGNARCDLECGAGCQVECPGTAGCAATMGDDSTGICNGSGTCDYTCLGDCTVDCPGVSSCTVQCAEGATCDITSCTQQEDCGGGLLACRSACPS